MAKQYDKQFKLDAIQYYQDHKDLGLIGCAENLGISQQSLSTIQNEFTVIATMCHRMILKNCMLKYRMAAYY